ncbi:radical SAM protein [Methanolapillus millepedarum]|uniref:Radical SAM core domain-containing protein n=1 Tax=Methanolapillus millepedarum TaxID=3028296 RepID=A0AA96VEX4_9EURY|nr:hypothetical protein MsAc7_09020 [Methanosarcinaceae archaeon Ac7]
MKKVTGFIERKSLLYKTDVEYGDYTVNHLKGCSHGCLYPCYAFMMAKRFERMSYEEWLEPKIVSNALELLDKEIPKNKHKIKSVHLSFSTDPFMYGYEDIADLSINVIKKLNNSDIPCTALTKGVLPERLAELSPKNQYGITLISLDEDFRKKMEPGSAPYLERISSLKRLHDAGCKTWVSIEPYPTPNIVEQDFSEILNSIEFADKIIFGRLNYNSQVSAYKEYKEYYNDLAKQVQKYCRLNRKECHIKNGTLTVLDKKPTAKKSNETKIKSKVNNSSKNCSPTV